MPRTKPSVASALERIARDIHDLSFDFGEPRSTQAQSDALIARAEDLAAELRAAVRGNGG